jgi:CelD/BcsL family acetyltransferase involved in cellulose biosynthesis
VYQRLGSQLRERAEWIGEPERFLALQAGWDRLAARQGTPFLRHGWFVAWWQAFGAGSRLRICALWRGDELAAVFPLRQRRNRLLALANDHTPVFRPFARDEDALRLVIEVALVDGAGELVIPAMPEDDPALEMIADASAQAGRLTLVIPQYVSPIVDTSGELSDYSNRLSSGFRRETRRLRRKMEREHDAEFVLVDAPSDLEGDLQRGFEVEARGWKGRNRTAILSSPTTASFYRSVARAFHEQGMLRLSSISLSGHPAAFDLSVLDQGRVFGLKIGYDEAFRSYGPGLVLQLAAIERCFELGLGGYEMLGESDEWKRRFATGERRYCTLHSYERRPLPMLRRTYRRMARPALKQAYARFRRGPSPARRA